MKITKYLLGLGLVAAMGMTSCSNDEPTVGTESTGNEAFFATVTLSLPTANGSRSQTVDPNEDGNSSDKTIAGEDYENKIKSILVVLATLENGQYTLQTVNQGDANSNGNAATPTYTLKFNSQAIVGLAGKNVYPFVICNPDAGMVTKFAAMTAGNTTFVDEIVQLTDGNNFSGWLNNNFLMTNAYIDETATAVAMPEAAELKTYNTSNNPFNLTQAKGAIKVERTVARFDFQATQHDGLEANTYEIKTSATTDPQTVGYVTLTGMTLINEAKDFYAFRRVSADGTSKDWTIGGLETPLNYMVSPNSTDLASRDFWFAAFNGANTVAPQSFDYTSLSGMNTSKYTIWRYATENAIPGELNQKKGITTGVVFKGHITFSDKDIAAVAASKAPIYKFGNTIYGGLAQLVAEIEANPNTYLAFQAKEAGLYTGIDADGKVTGLVTDESTFNTADGPQLSSKGFTVYRADADGNYNVYYYYWNRHNDNGIANVMGVMEFGVVRNNVYRLAVKNIYNFGHPGDPKDDDDPEDPTDPDESSDLYISLDVQVLPWVQRINNIEF